MIRKNAADKRTVPTLVFSSQDKTLGLSSKGAAILFGLPQNFAFTGRTIALIAGRLFECTSMVDQDFLGIARKEIACPVEQYLRENELSVEQLADELGENPTMIETLVGDKGTLAGDKGFLLGGKLFVLIQASRTWDVKPVQHAIDNFAAGDPNGRLTRFGHMTKQSQQQISRWADVKRDFIFVAGDVYMRRTEKNPKMGEPVKAITIEDFIKSHYASCDKPASAFADDFGVTMVQVRRYLAGNHIWCMDKSGKGDVYSNQSKFISKGCLLDVARNTIIYLD